MTKKKISSNQLMNKLLNDQDNKLTSKTIFCLLLKRVKYIVAYLHQNQNALKLSFYKINHLRFTYIYGPFIHNTNNNTDLFRYIIFRTGPRAWYDGYRPEAQNVNRKWGRKIECNH